MQFLINVAWRNLWRHQRRSLITAGAMAVGVALCMMSVAFQDGMYDELFRVMVEQQLGHVQVHHPKYPGTRVLHETVDESVVEALENAPGTQTVDPRLNGFVLLGGETKSAGAMLVGIDPKRAREASQIDERIVEGGYLDQGDILIGYKLREELEVDLGDSVVAVTQSSDGSLGNALFTVVGTFKLGNAQLDRSGAFVALQDLQDLLVLPEQVHQVTLTTKDPSRIEDYANDVRSDVGSDDVEVLTWWEASPQTEQLMGLRDVGAYIVLGIVFGAAAFGVLNTMMMSVFERTRELGVLRALGIRRARLVALVVVESLFLAALASSLGLVLGGLLNTYIVNVGFDMSTSGGEGFDFNGVVLDPVIYGVVYVDKIILIVAAVFVVSVLASLWPAYRAASLRPVEAIRSE